MDALVTGGAGFIGSHLAEALLARGDTVYIIDDLSTGSIRNIDHLKSNPRFHYTIDKVENVPVVAELVDRADVVFHLAAAVGVRLVVESPVRTIETNLRGTEIILEQANKKKRPVFFASTSEVYGKREQQPCCEDDDLIIGPTTKGRWSYACSKAMDEFLALAYCRERGLPVVIGRFFNTVGPRQTGRYGMVLPTFVRQALSARPITVYGDGEQTRCFGDVGDVVRAVISLVETPAAASEVFNIGNDQEITINRLAECVKHVAGSASPIVHIPYDQAYAQGFEDMRRRVPDLSKIRRVIGYEPKVETDEIIARAVEFQRVGQ
ncbi:MAG: GDP-mannose 4,6-dehydratase [Ardenticatenaceae bacterium]|nr:GDP-mannose 4,6-dehydratase [Ardenticatenaceae bacterium]HBY95018.1 nucleoside-diphosphate sugar epimerase [Chloroflexota bacterium]